MIIASLPLAIAAVNRAHLWARYSRQLASKYDTKTIEMMLSCHEFHSAIVVAAKASITEGRK